VPDLILTSPLRGWSAPLAEVPDPVFSQGMMGDGVAIDPLGTTLHAPCDGTIIHLHGAHHAVTLRSDEGPEILMHLGLETVALRGCGFQAAIREGQIVKRGDPLILFDLDMIAGKARSLITPIILTNAEQFVITRRHSDCMLGVGEALMTITPLETSRFVVATDGEEVLRRGVPIILAHGIHARPAARITDCARAFQSEISIVWGDRKANARSAVALLALGVKLNDSVDIGAVGPDAAQAVEAIAELLATGMGEASSSVVAKPSPRPATIAVAEGNVSVEPANTDELAGVVASSGTAIGQAMHLRSQTISVKRDGIGVEAERAALGAARAAVRKRILAALPDAHGPSRGVMEAHLAFLDDPDLVARAETEIDQGRSAGHAWRAALTEQAEILQRSGDARLAERASDLADIERQVLLELSGEGGANQDFPPDTILIADDLLPSQLMSLDLKNVRGFCLIRGGPTSHVAIIAGSMGLPALVAMGPALNTVTDGQVVILEASRGILHLAPDPERLTRMREEIAVRKKRRGAALAAAHQDCRSMDGTRIEVFANLGSLADTTTAVAHGAEGSGLLRTEFLFLDRASPPDEAEQLAQYQDIASALDGRPLIVRLLDVGGDKPAPYLPIPPEENPALGLRGIRVGLSHPHLLETQIRAILRVRPAGQCRIMVPMTASLAELRAVRTMVDKAQMDLGIGTPVEVGIMVETPAAAITADLLASEADFLSIGTNDLTQYVLAMDRGNAAVAGGIDALHPAILRMIGQTCTGASRHGRWTGVCGGLASDPTGIPILLGLGVTELSVTPAFVPEAKALIRQMDIPRCQALARNALEQTSAAAVRALTQAFLMEIE
jgi:phosphocarrier protein FPr/phosphocarrier protein